MRLHSYISPTTLILVLIALAVLWVLQFVAIIIFISFVLTLILLPLVRKLHTIHVPAVFAVFMPVILLSLIFGSLVWFMAPVISDQASSFGDELPVLIDKVPFVEGNTASLESVQRFLSDRLDSISTSALQTGAALAKTLIGILTVLVLTIYWLSGYEGIKKTLLSYLPASQRAHAKDIWSRVEHKLSRWFTGQFLVSLAVGLMVWLAAVLLGLPYAIVLALIAALLEIIPTIGPILAAVPAILIGASQSIEKAIIVTIVYLVIQQIESHVLSPMIMGKTVKLHPMMIIISLLIATTLFGLIGAFFAVPAALFVSAFVDYYRNTKDI